MRKPFKPSFFLKNKHIQTLYASVFANFPFGRKFKKHNFFVQKFTLSDGDFIECYWYNKPTNTTNKDIVMLFHGLGGSYKSPYIMGLVQELDKNGFESVVVHFRSASGVMNKKAKAYHSGQSEDAKEFIKYLSQKYPNNKLFAIAYSLGANMLLKLLGESKENSHLSAAIAVSAPMLLDVCANSINRGFSKFYQYVLMKDLNSLLRKKYDTHDMQKLINLKKQDIKNIKTFWQYDEIYTAKINGFKSAQDYYTKSSAKEYLKYIQTPTLIIHAKDDPFMSKEILPSKDEVSLHVELEIFEHGGHVGFVSGSFFKPHYWLESRAIEYFKNFSKAR
jgi:predicted alpha/beta-fold hydrolase